MTGIEYLALSPLICCVLAGVITMLVDAFVSSRAAAITAAATLAGVAGLAAWQAFAPFVAVGNAMFAGSGVTAAWSVIAATAALSVFGGVRDLSTRRGGGGVAALIVLSSAGAMLLAGSVDLLLTLIALETVAVCGYAIVIAGRTSRAAEASMKYVIQGAVATGLFLAGMAIHVGVTGGGTDLIGSVRPGMAGFALPATVATVFLLSAFAFKLGAAPFHSWAPDAFETAPPAGGAFMASAPKVGAMLGLITLFGITVETVAIREVPTLSHTVLFASLAVASIFIGNFGGLRQTSYLRMLGYSGIAQIGYALVGLAAGFSRVVVISGTEILVLAPVMLLVSVYAIAAVGAFLFGQVVIAARPEWDGSIEGVAGIGRQHPLLGVSLAVLMFSLTGIPLTAGFWGKLYVFKVAAEAGLEWLVLFAVIGSVVSFGYYGAVLRSAFFETYEPPVLAEDVATDVPADSDRFASGAMVACAVVVLVIGLAPLVWGAAPILAFFNIG